MSQYWENRKFTDKEISSSDIIKLLAVVCIFTFIFQVGDLVKSHYN